MRKTKRMTFPLGFGIVLLIIGIIILVTRPNDVIMKAITQTQIPLVDGSVNFETWKNIDLEFKVYLFHVSNPEEVQSNGDIPILVEYGPYVYDDHLERSILNVNESADTIEYVARRTLIFNATKSGDYSEDDVITVLNTAYIGTMLTIAGKFAPFVSSLGNNIPLLFPDQKSIFVKGKVKDILFDGLPLICDPETYPEITMICGVLNSQRPPIVRTTSQEGYYAYSFFHQKNGTDDGPYTISRGVKDRYTVGYISEFKGSEFADYWAVKSCSPVRGTDSIFYAPMESRHSEIYTFASDMCRSVHIVYVQDRVHNGLLGYHYRTSKGIWTRSNSSCYCPRAKDGTIKCPSEGSLDLEKCQKAPVIMTEPHFLHGSSSLSSMVEGLHPDVEKHASYVVVEPLTGIPLSGSRKIQLNMVLQPLPVDLLVNVSQGLLPLVWVEEGLTPGAKLLEPVILMHRLNRLLELLTWIPFGLGIIFIVYSYWMNRSTKTGYERSGRVTILAPKNTPNQGVTV